MLPALSFTHKQVEPSATWTISHNRNCEPIVHVYININGELQRCLPARIEAVTLNQVVVVFSAPQSGEAICQ